MANVTKTYFDKVLGEIEKIDMFHRRTVNRILDSILDSVMEYGEDEFIYLQNKICKYFRDVDLSPKQVAADYVHMLDDMRHEMKHFLVTGEYSYRLYDETNEKVYSNPKVMSYYINALLFSQLIWNHHFKMLQWFRSHITKKDLRVLDIGSGHGLLSEAVTRQSSNFTCIDVVDISKSSLSVVKKILDVDDRIHYHQQNIFDFDMVGGYDLVILGEILEHLDKPEELLTYIQNFLSKEGRVFISVPTNAPAIDHIYLFRSTDQVLNMIRRCGYVITEMLDIEIEGNTKLIGVICVKHEI